MKNQALISLATGFGEGYADGTVQRQNAERAKRREQREQELHDARMEELRISREQRAALASAAAPAQVDQGTRVTDDAGSDAFTKDPDAAAVMGDMAAAKGAQPTLDSATRVNKEVFTDPEKAKAAESEYNSTDATVKRQVKAMQTTDPAKAITLANAALENKQRLQKEADDAAFRKINSLQTPQDMADFMTEYPHDGMGGKFKAKAVPSADGKTWSFIGTDADGKEIKIPGDYTNDEEGMTKARMALAGRFGDPNRRLEFYKWEQEMGRKKAANAETARHNAVMEGAATKRADAALKAAGGGTGANNLTREERLRYTSLFTDAGRRLGEVNKTLSTLQRDFMFMKKAKQPGTPEADRLEELQESVAKYTRERDLYQGMLADSQTKPGAKPKPDAAPEPAAAAPAAGGEPKRITTAAERDALPAGARYIAPDGKTYIKQ